MHSITLTFPTLAELVAAVAKLSGTTTPGKSPTPSPAQTAPTERTASAAGADAQDTKASNSEPDPFGDASADAKPLAWADVMSQLREASKKPEVNKKFGELMKKWGVAKVPELEAKGQDAWRAALKDCGV